MPILRVRDENGNITDIAAIKGEPGKDAVTDQTFNPKSKNAQSGVAVAEANKQTKKYANNTFANAIKNTVKDSNIVLTDQSSVEHELDVKVLKVGKNLLPKSVYEGTDFTKVDQQFGGVITWAVNDDGTINVSNTDPMAVFSANVTTNTFTLEAGTYTFSMGTSMLVSSLYKESGAHIGDVFNSYPLTFTLNETTNLYIASRIPSGSFSEIAKPQIELGTSVTEYEEYGNASDVDLKSVTVTRQGKNLISPNFYGMAAANGITFTDNEDGSINIDGTSFGQSSFYFDYYTLKLKKGVAYTVSAKGDFVVNGSMTLYVYASPATQGGFALNLYTNKSLTFVPQKDMDKMAVYLVIPADRTVSGRLYPQLEINNAQTDYEPYVTPQTFTPNEDGMVKGITSLYPTTVLTNDKGLPMECTYNMDTKKYIDNKFAELSAAILNS